MAKSTTASKATKTTKSKPAPAAAAKTKAAAPAAKPAAKATAKAPAAKPAAKATSKAPAAKPSKENLGDDAIAKRAYEIWVEQGYPEGRDIENWARAEKELKGKK